MKTVMFSLAAAVALAGTAQAELTSEGALYGGSHMLNYATGQWSQGGEWSNFTGTAYDSTNFSTSGATGYGVGATSTTDLAAIYGDQMVMSGTGTLDSFKFAVFVSGSSTANLTSATETIRFYRSSDSSYIGGFTVTLGSLTKGYYSVYTVNTLASLGINLDTTDVLVTQQLSSVVGATRMGTVFSNASNSPAIGSTNAGIYMSNSTTTAGFYTFTGYTTFSSGVFSAGLVDVPAPGALALLGVAGLIGGRRRR